MKKIFLPILILFSGLLGVTSGAPNLTLAEEQSLPTLREIGNAADFIELIDSTSNINAQKNYDEKQKLNIKLTSDIDLSGRIFKDYTFYGKLDGNGHSLSNLNLASSGKNYGLFTTAADAVIENLRVEGQVTYTFGNGSDFSVGVLVGSGSNVQISKCEFDVEFKTKLGEQEVDGIVANSSLNFGVAAGSLSNGKNDTSKVINCINYSPVNLTHGGTSETNLGGFVGTMTFGELKYLTNYGSTNLNSADALTQSLSVGGIIGAVGAGKIQIQNCAVVASVQGSSDASVGALVGRLSELGKFDRDGSVIDNCYFTPQLEAIGSGPYTTNANTCKRVSSINAAAFRGENLNIVWAPGLPKFKFDDCYMWRADRDALGLQVFQSFEIGVADVLDSAIEFVSIENPLQENPRSSFVKFGQSVKIVIKYRDEIKSFYGLPEVIFSNGDVVDKSTYTIEYLDAAQIRLTILSSSLKTEGLYAFTPTPISFRCEVESADNAQGSVKWGNDNAFDLVYHGQIQKITAQGKGSFDFVYWEMFTGIQTDNGIEWSTTPDEVFAQSDYAGSASIPIGNERVYFGNAPFSTSFKLVAHFSQDSAIKVRFSADDKISEIKFNQTDYQGTDLLVSPMAKRIELSFIVAKGYKFNEDRFIKDIKSLYGEISTSSVIVGDPTQNDDGSSTYTYKLDMPSLAPNLIDRQLTLSLSSTRIENQNGDNLLWLWITLPIVLALAIGGVVAFLIIRRRMYGNFEKKGKAQKPTKEKTNKGGYDDYKDLYY